MDMFLIATVTLSPMQSDSTDKPALKTSFNSGFGVQLIQALRERLLFPLSKRYRCVSCLRFAGILALAIRAIAVRLCWSFGFRLARQPQIPPFHAYPM